MLLPLHLLVLDLGDSYTLLHFCVSFHSTNLLMGKIIQGFKVAATFMCITMLSILYYVSVKEEEYRRGYEETRWEDGL